MAWTGERPAVLLIDDINELNDGFSSYLLGWLRDHRPGTSRLASSAAMNPPFSILTATGPGQAPAILRSASLYHWLGYPTFEREYAILTRRLPNLGSPLAGQICNFVARLRKEDFERRPGIAETIDLARALFALHRDRLDPDTIEQTLGCILKHPADIERFRTRRLASRLGSRLDRAG